MNLTTPPSYLLGQQFTDAEARLFTIVGLVYEGRTGIVMEFETDQGKLYIDADYENTHLTGIDIKDGNGRVFRRPVDKMDELFKTKQLINL